MRELPSLTVKDIVRILELDFKENQGKRRSIPYDYGKKESGRLRMETMKWHEVQGTNSTAWQSFSSAEPSWTSQKRFLRDLKYKEDYIKFINEVLYGGDAE